MLTSERREVYEYDANGNTVPGAQHIALSKSMRPAHIVITIGHLSATVRVADLWAAIRRIQE